MKKIKIKGWKKGEKIEIEASNLFLGSADFLRPDNADFVCEMIEKYMECGGNAFDTAEHYRHSEPAIGAWLAKTKKREQVVIFTKGCHPKREARDVSRVNAACIREDIEHSLKTMGVDHVEMFALHRDDVNTPVSEIMEELHYQIEIGNIYAAGVSNWELDRIVEANAYAKEHDLHPLTFNSPNLSLARPMMPRWPGCVSASDEMVEWHKENDIAMISWSSQAGGFFSGRFTRDTCDDEEMRACFYNKENWERYDRCVTLAGLKKKTPIQIALAWLLHQPFAVAAAIGPETKAELISSIEGSEVKLSANELAFLDLERNTYE
ncbi:MAG: aldo/keto reductase [Breznakia sp.]